MCLRVNKTKSKPDRIQGFPESWEIRCFVFNEQKCYSHTPWCCGFTKSKTTFKETDRVGREERRTCRSEPRWDGWRYECYNTTKPTKPIYFCSHSGLLWFQLLRLLRIAACLSAGCHTTLPRVRLIWLTLTALRVRCLIKKAQDSQPLYSSSH